MSSLAAPAFVTGGAPASRDGRVGADAVGALVERARQGDGRAFDRLMIETQERVVKKAAGKAMRLEYHISSLSLEPGENGPATVKLDGFALSLVGDGRAQLRTDVTLRDGEKVVVGTSTVQDKGLVVVISARVIR